MKLRYISKSKRRYLAIGREFPSKKDVSQNEIDVKDELGKLLLCERDGSCKVWEVINTRRAKAESTEEVK